MIRSTVTYSGRVQGVGFRATTAEIARRFSIEGTVRNLEDGTVEVVAQGEPADVDSFLGTIEEAFVDKIRHVRRQSDAPIEPSGGFRVVT